MQADPDTSGGKWLSLDAENAGSWMELTTPEIPAGRYDVGLRWKGNASRGIAGFSLDGQALSVIIDQYAAAGSHTSTSLGTFSFDGTAAHALRLRVTGKNDSSDGYQLSADQLTFTAR